MHPYPTDLPPEALRLVIDALRGSVDVKEISHATWHVVGYGLSQWDVHAPVLAVAALSYDEVAAQLEKLLPSETETKAAVIPWQVIIPLLLEALIKWLTRPKGEVIMGM